VYFMTCCPVIMTHKRDDDDDYEDYSTQVSVFTARSSCASAVLVIVILSVRLSHACSWRNKRTYCQYFDTM